MLNESKIWYAVSIHKLDGHKINGYFVTDSREIFLNFCESLKPLLITFTRFQEENAARKLVQNFPISFVEICPLTYPTYATYSRLSCIKKTETQNSSNTTRKA